MHMQTWSAAFGHRSRVPDVVHDSFRRSPGPAASPRALRVPVALLRLAALVVLAAGLLSAGLLAACGDAADVPGPAETVTVTASPSPSGSATVTAKPSPKPSSSVNPQSVIAAAAGPQANSLVAVAPSTKKTVTLVPAKAGAITAIAWSPDRTRIAYSQLKSTTSGDEAIWVYDLAKKKVSPVKVAGGTPKSVAGFTWLAPTKVLCAVIVGATSYHTNGQMYVCDVAKGSSSQLKDDKGAVVRGIWPHGSDDFTAVSYVRYGPPAGASQPTSLMVYDAGTAVLSKVAHDKLYTDVDNERFAYPSISPDGSLVYTCSTGSDPGFSAKVTADDGSTAFTKGPLYWPAPGAWDAVSGRLAFGGSKTSALQNGVLWIWKPGTATTTAVYKATKRLVDGAAWSPTGDYIAFSLISSTGGAARDLWVVGAAGGGPHLVLKNAGEPAWAKAAVPGL